MRFTFINLYQQKFSLTKEKFLYEFIDNYAIDEKEILFEEDYKLGENIAFRSKYNSMNEISNLNCARYLLTKDD